jgi:hypothetical protein
MLFKNPVRTSKRTPHFTITEINWLTLFKEIIAVYSEDHTKPYTQCVGLLIVKANGIYSYRSALKGQITTNKYISYVLLNRQIHTTIWYYYVISVYHNLYIIY